MYNEISQLLIVSNEIFKRYSEKLEKEAQYESVASQLVPRIIDKLLENEIIDISDADNLKETMLKSASASLEVLDNVLSAIDSFNIRSSSGAKTGVFDLGKPASTFVSKYDDIRKELIEDFVIDISKLR